MPDYDAMADDYAAHPPTADEVIEVAVRPFLADPITLKNQDDPEE